MSTNTNRIKLIFDIIELLCKCNKKQLKSIKNFTINNLNNNEVEKNNSNELDNKYKLLFEVYTN